MPQLKEVEMLVNATEKKVNCGFRLVSLKGQNRCVTVIQGINAARNIVPVKEVL